MRSTTLSPAAAAGVALLVALSCSESTGPDLTVPGIRVIAGGSPDTVAARPTQALIVEARGDGGALASGKIVRFTSLPGPRVFVAPLSSTTFTTFAPDTADRDGRAGVLLGMGTVAGEARLEISVPELGLADTVLFTIGPGAPTHARFNVRDTVLLTDSSFTLTASVRDGYDNPRTETATLTNLTPSFCSLTGSQVTGTAMGRCMIMAQHGEMRDTARASVLPAGRLAVVASNHSLRLVSMNGTGSRSVLSTSDAVLSPGWAPDGSALVIYEGDPTSSSRLSVVDTMGVRLATVGPDQDMIATLGRFSPDGQWVYFTGRSGSDPFLIWRMKPDGSQRAAVTTADADTPYRVDASPDGVTIAYDVLGEIVLANVNTQQKTPTGVLGITPSYSPDGQTIAFYGWSNDGGSGLRLMDANGTNVRVLLPGAFLEWQPPQWVLDGQWLLVPGPRFVRVSDGTVVAVPVLGFTQATLKPPLGQ